jgi:hypothetical protein
MGLETVLKTRRPGDLSEEWGRTFSVKKRRKAVTYQTQGWSWYIAT